MDYLIEYGNEGLKQAQNITITAYFKPELNILAASAGATEGSENWKIENIPPGSRGQLYIKGTVPSGLSQGSKVMGDVSISGSSGVVPPRNPPECLRIEESSPTTDELTDMLCPTNSECRTPIKSIFSGFPNHYQTNEISAHRTTVKQYAGDAISYKNNCDGTCSVKYLCHKRTSDEYGFLKCGCGQCSCEYKLELDPIPVRYWETTCFYTGEVAFALNKGTYQTEYQVLEYRYDCEPNNCQDPDPKDDSQSSDVVVAHDPNIKYGPEGRVSAAQQLDYRIEFENEGDGTAYGVYFTDMLDEDLDASTLSIGPVYSTSDGKIINPPGSYDPNSRTITWLVGEVGSHMGGYANISVNIRGDAPNDTEVINYGTVYFPSVPEVTRTNSLVCYYRI